MFRNKPIGNEKGSISVYAIATVFCFVIILSGIFISTSVTRKNQLRTLIKIKEIYAQEIKIEVKDITTITTTNHETLKAKDKHGNVVIVPEGFKVVAGKEGEEISVQNGVVIEDSAGNQFVWIPVGIVTKNDGTKSNEIVLGRYTFADKNSIDPEPGTPTLVQNASEYAATTADIVKNDEDTVRKYNIGLSYEVSDERKGVASNGLDGLNATAKNLAQFVQSVKDNGGYYLARYEASYGSGYNAEGTTDDLKYGNAKPLFKPSTAHSTSSMDYTPGTLWNFITELNASKVARNMYDGNKDINGNGVGVESDLVNSYAWDTAIVYIQQMEDSNYANHIDGSGTMKNTGETGEIKCNVYDMGGNAIEWTTESSKSTYDSYHACPCTVRGGNFNSSNDYTAFRYPFTSDDKFFNLSFRSILYVK